MAGDASHDSAQDRSLINAGWLLRLRWVAVVGQLTTVAIATAVFGAELRLPPLFAIIGLTLLTNVAFAVWLRSRRRQLDGMTAERMQLVMAGILATDLLSLTGLLYFSGGTANPFAVFYFVNLSLADVILPARWSW